MFAICVLVCGVFLSVWSQPAVPLIGPSLDESRGYLQGVLDCGVKNGLYFTAVVVDLAGNTVASMSMDGTGGITHTLAREKALTAINFGAESYAFKAYFNPENILFRGDQLLGISALGGGVPIMNSNGSMLLGALGVSGAPTDVQDRGCALEALNKTVSMSTLNVNSTLFPALYDANFMITRAEATARTLNTYQAISVLDASGLTTMFTRMDSSLFCALNLAPKKAISALKANVAGSEMLASGFGPSGAAFTGDNSNGYLTPLPGGFVLKNSQNAVVAAIGCSGSYDASVDQQVCRGGFVNYTLLASPPRMLNLNNAYSVLQAGLTSAYNMNVGVTIAIVDQGGNVRALYSTPGMPPGSVAQAIRKAQTMALLPIDASQLNNLVRPGAAYDLGVASGGLVSYSGASPLFLGNTLVGGVGVFSEGSIGVDNTISQSAATAVTGSVSPSSINIPPFDYKKTIEKPVKTYPGQAVDSLMLHASCVKATQVSSAPIACASRDGMGVLRVALVEDGAVPGSVDLAFSTSQTAFMFPHASDTFQYGFSPVNTSTIAGASVYYTGEYATNPRIVATPGGVPLMDASSNMVGSLGVSSSLTSGVADRSAATQASSYFMSMYTKNPFLPTMTCDDSSEKAYKRDAIVLGILFALSVVVIIVLAALLHRTRDGAKSKAYDPLQESFINQ